MSKKPRRKFALELKQEIVRQYLSGERSVEELATKHEIATGQIYKWKSQLEERAKTTEFNNLVAAGTSPESARIIQRQKAEIEAYQRKIAELTVINDLLKKSQIPRDSLYESELSGLIDTIKKSARKKRPHER